MNLYHHPDEFPLECGQSISELNIAYHTFGKLNKAKDNVVWICHALTANSDVQVWWPDIAGPEGVFNTDKYFVVCVNMIGSCYGSTSPLDINLKTGEPYYYDFPLVTIRDIVQSQILLMEHLEIENLFACIGGSCGGHQVLELAIMMPDRIRYIFPVVTSARETAWSIAIHTAQRMAIESDKTWGEKRADAGMEGMKAARGMGLLTYRSYQAYIETQTDDDHKIDQLKASSYIRYQGEKLAGRQFNALTYWHMTKTLDTHHIGRARGPVPEVLAGIRSKTLVIGVDSDILIPPSEQEYLAKHIPDAGLSIISSLQGHDSFLIKQKTIAKLIGQFISKG